MLTRKICNGIRFCFVRQSAFQFCSQMLLYSILSTGLTFIPLEPSKKSVQAEVGEEINIKGWISAVNFCAQPKTAKIL